MVQQKYEWIGGKKDMYVQTSTHLNKITKKKNERKIIKYVSIFTSHKY